MNLKCCVVASRIQVGVVAVFPRVEVLESHFYDALCIVRSHENQTLVVDTKALVYPLDSKIDSPRENDLCPSTASTYNLTKLPLPSDESIHTLVDPCKNQGGPTLVHKLPTTSEVMDNDQSGGNDLDMLDCLGNPNCCCLGKNGFAYDTFAAHDSLCLCRDYSIETEGVAFLEIPSTSYLCVYYVKPTSVVGLETSEYMHKETIGGVDSCDTFLYHLCAYDIFHRYIEGMPNFEDDTLGLPVRSLLRFKCVAKFWKTLVDDPYFRMKHLNHTKNDKNIQKFLFYQLSPMKDIFSIHSCSLSSAQVEEVRKLDFPSNVEPLCCQVYCCFDVLAIIRVDESNDESHILLLWNPSTGESIVIPTPEFSVEGYCCLGMSFDSNSDDFKIPQYGNEGRNVSSEILTLKSDSWRKINEHPGVIFNMLYVMHSMACIHGAFHWVGFSRNYCVVSLNISNEEYGEIPLPDGICLRDNTDIGIS
ncbi:hypothetical protein CQW23_30493 [Capsicum baccatum]|uniref:F-box associated beta-propeller type 3 domain-containing protein n=1 Tax=Capsicum baccatum TaxID=33114 RepID=A0A2G2VA96_CAPBA|nr:hypothetical protein CQW23_30493 [Capsicum baccatum]